MCQKKRDVGNQVARIDRVADQQVRAGCHDAAIGRHQTKAAAQHDLSGDHEAEACERNHSRRGVRQESHRLGGSDQRRAGNRDRRHERRGRRAIHGRGPAAHHGEHDHQRLAHEQQQPRQVPRLHELPEHVDRQEQEQHSHEHAGEQIREQFAIDGPHVSGSPAGCESCPFPPTGRREPGRRVPSAWAPR